MFLALLSGGETAAIIIVAILVVLTLIVFNSLKIVRQSNAIVIERLGKYHKTLYTGYHFIFPFIDRISLLVTLKEQVIDYEPQSVITKDNVTMKIDTVIYFQITTPHLFTYGVHNPMSAIENLTATTLRNIIGDMELDETLTSRDKVNDKMRKILDEATDPWGIKVNRVELKNIIPPRDIQEAMEKQMRAERERREIILRAEGEKRSQILIAEGERESDILRARAYKETLILKAEGEKEAIELITKAKPSQEYITLQSFETFKKVADGQATKLIIPSELQNLASLVSSIQEIKSTKK